MNIFETILIYFGGYTKREPTYYFCDFSRDVFKIFCESDPMGCLGFDIKLDECSTRIEANYTSVPGTIPPFLAIFP